MRSGRAHYQHAAGLFVWGLSFCLFSTPNAGAQESHALRVGGGYSGFDHPGCGAVPIYLDNSSAVSELVVAVCHNPALLRLEGIAVGGAAKAADFVDASSGEEGGVLTVVMDTGKNPSGVIPPGESQVVGVLDYCCNGSIDCFTSISARLRLCDGTLAAGAENRVMVGERLLTAGDGLALEDGHFDCVGECPPPEENCFDGQDNDGNGLTDCDDPYCRERAECAGRRLPGDCNDDGSVNMTDAICLFGFLFRGDPAILPCGFRGAALEGNRTLLDWQGDGKLNLTDGVNLLRFLFASAPAHWRAVPGRETSMCVEIVGCPESDSCVAACAPPPPACPVAEPEDLMAGDFIRGDVNGDGTVGVVDAVLLLGWLCGEGPAPACLDAADTNDDGCVNLRDIHFFPVPGFCPLLDLDSCRPRAPYPEPGPDPRLDYLGCNQPAR